jgi:membrane protein implicated in regulation of membrane protease activity
MPALALLILLLALVQRWVDLPAWFIYGLIVFWVTKDVILFFFTWRAYDQDSNRAVNSMVGARGITKNRLAPSGYIWVHGELWQAEIMGNALPVERREAVRVQGIRGLTLLVQRDDENRE